MSHRWQYSDKHFVGEVEQKHREIEGSQVINDVHVVDLSVSYAVSKRFTATLSIPYQHATRSQAVSDPRIRNQFNRATVIDRYTTEANGMGDIKLLGTVWLLDPEHNKKQNISLGLGVLFPTGEKDVKDSFKVFATNSAGTYTPRFETRNVDNSIQPGAGAWGLIMDIYAFKELFTDFNAYVSATYIATPEEDAGVNDGPGTTGRIWSVGDSYLARGGVGYTFLPKYGLTLTFGARMEGSPSTDFIGDDGGRRRPGYAISVEPGLVFAKNGWFVSFSAPVAIYRNRDPDFTGSTGDAAFADFMTLFSVGRRF